VLERDVHPVGTLLQAGDRVAEQVLRTVAGRFVQDPAQVAAQDLHVTGEDLRRHRGQHLARFVDVADRGEVGLLGADPVQDSHLGQDAQVGGAAEVDGVAAATQLRGALHHGRVEAVPAEPVGEGRAGDARAGDQNIHDQNHTYV
jgi:hypothetical protein